MHQLDRAHVSGLVTCWCGRAISMTAMMAAKLGLPRQTSAQHLHAWLHAHMFHSVRFCMINIGLQVLSWYMALYIAACCPCFKFVYSSMTVPTPACRLQLHSIALRVTLPFYVKQHAICHLYVMSIAMANWLRKIPVCGKQYINTCTKQTKSITVLLQTLVSWLYYKAMICVQKPNSLSFTRYAPSFLWCTARIITC